MINALATVNLPDWRVAENLAAVDRRGVELSKRIGMNMRAAREARDLSLAQVGARCEPPTGYTQISRLEQGERRLTLDWVERIAKALGMDPFELMVGKPSPTPATTLSEPVAIEAARSLVEVVTGGPPGDDIVQVVALMLRQLTESFSLHPQAYRDPAIARPVIDLISRLAAPSTH